MPSKQCSQCGLVKDETAFYKRETGRLRNECKDCFNQNVLEDAIKAHGGKEGYLQWRRDLFQENKPKWYINRRKYHYRKKHEAFQKLGGKCCIVGCGVSDEDMLHIDHKIPVTTTKERRLVNGPQLFRDVMLHPEKYELLCANHHAKKTAEERCKINGKGGKYAES